MRKIEGEGGNFLPVEELGSDYVLLFRHFAVQTWIPEDIALNKEGKHFGKAQMFLLVPLSCVSNDMGVVPLEKKLAKCLRVSDVCWLSISRLPPTALLASFPLPQLASRCSFILARLMGGFWKQLARSLSGHCMARKEGRRN